MKVLVVGATGQLGSKLIQKKSEFSKDLQIKALVRRKSNYQRLDCSKDDLIFGDLTDKPSLIAACQGIDFVISTATVVFPRGQSNFEDDERQGYRNLVEACEYCGVKQIIFISVAVEFEPIFTKRCKTYELKQWCEELLIDSKLAHTILRCPLFMDDYFALIGSQIPLKGEKLATISRSTGLTRLFNWMVCDSVEKYGIAWIPGAASNRHAFISVEDVANYCIKVTGNREYYDRTLKIGGPENLSWNEVCSVFSEVLSKPVKAIQIPSSLLLLLYKSSNPFSEKISNQIGILWIIANTETVKDDFWDSTIANTEMLTAKKYLSNKV